MPDVDLLVIGLSRFARRRVLPAAAELAELGAAHVASRSATNDDLARVPKRGRAFRDYGEAIDAIAPALVYISLTNDAHAAWAERALLRGHHVIVDKPAFVELADAERLAALARARGRVLAEATTYAFHPLWTHVRRVVAPGAPALVTVAFTPPVPPDDHRHRRALGGGAIHDTGPYFASVGRVLWGAAPRALHAIVSARAEVELAYSVLADYGEGRALVGHFGFTAPYRNWMHVASEHVTVEARGVFSTPPDVVTELAVQTRDATTVEHVPAAFAMRLFLAEVLAAIARGDGSALADALLADARVRDQLRRAAHA